MYISAKPISDELKQLVSLTSAILESPGSANSISTHCTLYVRLGRDQGLIRGHAWGFPYRVQGRTVDGQLNDLNSCEVAGLDLSILGQWDLREADGPRVGSI